MVGIAGARSNPNSLTQGATGSVLKAIVEQLSNTKGPKKVPQMKGKKLTMNSRIAEKKLARQSTEGDCYSFFSSVFFTLPGGNPATSSFGDSRPLLPEMTLPLLHLRLP